MEVDMQQKSFTAGCAPTDVVLPSLVLSQYLHKLRFLSKLITPEEKQELRDKVMHEIKKDEMLNLYLALCEEFEWVQEEELIEKLKAANQRESRKLAEALKDAEENYGDVEVRDCLLARASFLCRIGDFDNAIIAYNVAKKKTVGAGIRLDILLTLIRIGLLMNKPDIAKKYIADAKVDCESGGDWERQNKLRICEALYCARFRKFPEGKRLFKKNSLRSAAQLMLSCVSIFMLPEVISFESFIFLTVVLAMAEFDRPTLKKKIIPNSDIAQVLEQDPLLKTFLHSFYYCKYRDFMFALVDIYERLRRDFWLMHHARYLIRSIRLKAYQQFLEPFSSVTVSLMAETFGLSDTFLENDLVDFIVNKKLTCKIDKVSGVIMCIKNFPMTTMYEKTIKEGDLLLTKIQKLSKIVDL